MNNIYDISIIGGGPIGIFCIFQAGMLSLNVAIIDTLNFLGGQCRALYAEKPIYDIAGFPVINAEELVENLLKQARPFKAKQFLGQQCNNIVNKGEYWEVITSKNIIKSKTIIVATGSGIFEPRKPMLDNIGSFENISLFYYIKNKNLFKDKIVTIAGGGDSALDWAVVLANGIAKKIYLIHRNNKFRAAPKTIAEVQKLASKGIIDLIIPYQLHKLKGVDGMLKEIEVKDLENNIISFKSDYLLPFFGTSMNIELMSNWNLAIKHHHVEVNPATMLTNLTGVFAAGDVCNYPGKLKLIITGFAEAARACHSVYKFIYPNSHTHFQYSTNKGVPAE